MLRTVVGHAPAAVALLTRLAPQGRQRVMGTHALPLATVGVTQHRDMSGPALSGVRVLPAAARLIQLNDIKDVQSILASGPKGHVTKGDVLSFLKGGNRREKADGEKKQAHKAPPQKQAAGAGAGGDFDVLPVSERAGRMATTYSTSKRMLAHAYLQADVDSSGLRRASDETGCSTLAWIAKAAAKALHDNTSVAVVRKGTDGIARVVFNDAGARTVQDIETAISESDDSYDERHAAINVFEHEAMSVVEIIPSDQPGMAVSVGADVPHVAIGTDGQPRLSTKRTISLSFDASSLESTEAAAALEAIAKCVENPNDMLL